MALLSPGTQVTVIDESFFAPAVSTSIPYILLATAQDKTNSSGDVAAATTADQVNVVRPVTSRRELVSLFGNPQFEADATGGVVQGSELNEYGLQTAYSLLGVTNRVYVQRADIDLGQLTGTSVRPTNAPANGTIWLDLSDTDFGLFEWNASDQTFNKITPIVIEDVADQTAGVPNSDIGTIGDYAVVAVSTANPVYYKDGLGAWVLVGSDAWLTSSFTYQGTVANPTFTASDSLDINTVTVTLTGTTLASLVSDINTAAIPGVSATAQNNKLTFFVNNLAASDGVTPDGKLFLDNPVGTVFGDAGITGGVLYNTLETQLSAHTSVPEWKSGDAEPRPTGSVWVKTTLPNDGADFNVNLYDEPTETWNRVDAPLYANNGAANKVLDAVGGGINIAQGAQYVRYDTLEDGTATYELFLRQVKGQTEVAGATANPTFTPGDEVSFSVSQIGVETFTGFQTVTLTGTTATDFATDVMNAAIENLEAYVDTAGKVVLVHTAGGTIIAVNTTNIPLTDAGFSSALTFVEDGNNGDLVISNWVPTTYTASSQQPSVDPADGTLWYFADVDDCDILVHDGSAWRGYQNVSNDARNYDLTLTSPDGPIVSASEPTTQSDGTQIELGDLWIDTSDLTNYPVINRWTALGAGQEGWVTIDNADDTSENGIVFQDARWDTDGTSDTITDSLPLITDLLTSDYVDLDAPDAALYPRGTLLFNTRRSGFTVKQYTVDYFNANTFVGVLPAETNTWRTVSGLKSDGSPYMGSAAVRNMVVQVMKAGLDASITARDEQTTVNLLAAPGYPELLSNLVKLNTDRKETAFVVGDSPMTLPADSLSLANWAGNANLADDNGVDGLVTSNSYAAVYYPAGLSNDLDGNAVVVPSSHMALRTIIRSDNQSYPWIAPAGVRRGKVDNATSIGFIDAQTGEYQSIGLGEGLRDVLYTNNVNPITVLPGNGITVFGQKTRQGVASSLDRVNVARLTASLRYVLDLIAKPFVFEPNDKLTRDEFKNEIEKYMNELVAKRAIFDYLVVVDESNNTPARIDRNELWADVAIEPVKAAEFIFIPLRLQNTGEI